MQTFSVKVRPQESVKQTKRNGEWVKRYRVLGPDGLTKDVKHVPDALVEYLKEQGVECRIAESGCPYVFTIEQLTSVDHFKLTKVDKITYSLEELRVHTAYVTETVKVLF